MQTRRQTLKQSAVVAGLLAGTGLFPQYALAFNKAAFDAKSLNDALKALGASGAPAADAGVTLTAPDIAENGAVVPLAVASTLPNVKQLLLLVEKNPNALVAVFNVTPEVDASFATRAKMGESSDVYAVAITADGKAHYGHARGPRRGQGAGVGIAQQCGHRHHVIPRRSSQRPGVAGHRPGLLRGAGQRLRTGNGRCGIKHVPIAPRRGKSGALVDLRHLPRMARAVLANGGAAPGLGPTGNDDVGLPQCQQGAGVGDGIQPGAALAIECPGGHPVGQPGTQGGQAGRVAIGPQGIAQNERIHRLDRHPRTLQQVRDQRGGQIRQRASGQRPAHRGHRGARPAKDGPGRG